MHRERVLNIIPYTHNTYPIEQTCRIILCTTSINSNYFRIGIAEGWYKVQSLFIYNL